MEKQGKTEKKYCFELLGGLTAFMIAFCVVILGVAIAVTVLSFLQSDYKLLGISAFFVVLFIGCVLLTLEIANFVTIDEEKIEIKNYRTSLRCAINDIVKVEDKTGHNEHRAYIIYPKEPLIVYKKCGKCSDKRRDAIHLFYSAKVETILKQVIPSAVDWVVNDFYAEYRQ